MPRPSSTSSGPSENPGAPAAGTVQGYEQARERTLVQLGQMAEVRAVLAAHPAPAGIRVELGGRYASQQQAFRSLLLVLALAALSVLAIMLLQFRAYSLPFRAPVRTAHGSWVVRTGVIVRLEDPSTGHVGWGEASPVPGFGSETAEADAGLLRTLGVQPGEGDLARIPPGLPCLRRALATAIAALTTDSPPEVGAFLPVAALLPAGKEALATVPSKAEAIESPAAVAADIPERFKGDAPDKATKPAKAAKPKKR
mgnify:CR=1 FL=1